jgi:anti-anti-sigma factor
MVSDPSASIELKASIDLQDGVLNLRGPLNLGSVPALQKACLEAAGAGGLVVDLADSTAVDSSALALLMSLRRAVELAGGHFELRNPPAALRVLGELYGVGFLVDNAAPDV